MTLLGKTVLAFVSADPERAVADERALVREQCDAPLDNHINLAAGQVAVLRGKNCVSDDSASQNNHLRVK
jgi:hypothetical protein